MFCGVIRDSFGPHSDSSVVDTAQINVPYRLWGRTYFFNELPQFPLPNTLRLLWDIVFLMARVHLEIFYELCPDFAPRRGAVRAIEN